MGIAGPQVNQLTDAGSEHKLSFWLCQLGDAGTGTGLRRAVAQWLESYSRTSGSGSAPVARAMARMCPRA